MDLNDPDPLQIGFCRPALSRLDDHFRRYVDEGKLPFFQLAVMRGGILSHYGSYGQRDVEAKLPVGTDTILRIYSMTKPITSVAALMLLERGAFQLTDPVSAYIASFASPRVWVGGSAEHPITAPARNAIQVRDLMRHTAGLAYAHGLHPLDDMYKRRGYEYAGPAGVTLEGAVEEWAALPLLYEPGTSWSYSHATDVLGRLVEVVSGQPLDAFLKNEILDPLGMTDTHFRVPAGKLSRLAAVYRPSPSGGLERFSRIEREVIDGGHFLSGGGGLVSTVTDYLRFAEMLRRGGTFEGARLLGSRTVAYMARNHLPGNVDMASFGRPVFPEAPHHGVGFGLGVSVVTDPVRQGVTGSAGEYGWGGAASTVFMVDPVEGMTAILTTQLMPSNAYPLRGAFRALLYAALE